MEIKLAMILKEIRSRGHFLSFERFCKYFKKMYFKMVSKQPTFVNILLKLNKKSISRKRTLGEAILNINKYSLLEYLYGYFLFKK